MRKPNYHTYRHPRTTQEKRQNQDWKYVKVRGKRHPRMLPDAWNDVCRTETKCWKDKRKKQWRPESRNKRQRHEMIFDNSLNTWKLEKYFQKHDIPYTLEKRCRRVKKVYILTKKRYLIGFDSFKPIYEEVTFDPPQIKEYNYSERLGWKVIWWSNQRLLPV